MSEDNFNNKRSFSTITAGKLMVFEAMTCIVHITNLNDNVLLHWHVTSKHTTIRIHTYSFFWITSRSMIKIYHQQSYNLGTLLPCSILPTVGNQLVTVVSVIRFESSRVLTPLPEIILNLLNRRPNDFHRWIEPRSRQL